MFGKLKGYEQVDNKIMLRFAEKDINVEIINERVVRFFEEKTTKSFAVEENFKGSCYTIEFDKTLIIKTKEIVVHIEDDFVVNIYSLDGKELLVDKKQVKQSSSSGLDENLLKLEGHKTHSAEEYAFLISKKLHKDESFFGLGDKTGYLNKREYEYIMWNTDDPAPHVDCFKALYKSIPFFIGNHSDIYYGVFLDNTYKSVFNMGVDNETFYFGSKKGTIDYYFIYGPSIKDVVGNYTLLTGRYPLPQIWTLGNQQCRWGYPNKESVDEVIEGFAKNQIPLDVIHLDIDYMKDYKVFTFDEHKFPDAKEYIKELREKGIKVVCIIDPGVKAETGYKIYDEGVKNNYFAQLDGEIYHNAVWPGDSVFPAFTSNAVQKWWANNTKILMDMGVSGIWNDMNEPASFNGPLPDNVEFMGEEKVYLHEEIHNVYGHLMAKATYEGLEKTHKRPFIITRACYAGTQRYSTGWTGDNHSMWAHIGLSIVQLLNLGLSGMPFVGSDIGGFGSNCTKELMARWIEVGCFSPLFRNHSAMGTRLQEPWRFDDELIDIYRKHTKIRYQLIPYYYDLFWCHEATGYPVMRPLFFHYETDKNTFNLNDEFMIGESLIISPVVSQGQTKKIVYLPEGTWYDYYTKKRQDSGYSLVDAPLGTCPMFVKAGSIIPNYEEALHIQNLVEKLILDVYPGTGQYTHYLDDKESFAYKDGEYSLYEMKLYNNILTIDLVKNDYPHLYKEFEIHYQGKVIQVKASTHLEIKL